MANINTYQTKQPQSRHVVMVIYPDAHILDIAGPIEILTGTRLFIEQDIEPYKVSVVAERSGPVSTTCGLTLEADKSFASAKRSLKQIDRYNVMYMIRHGGQAQFSTQLIEQRHDDGALSDTLYILDARVQRRGMQQRLDSPVKTVFTV